MQITKIVTDETLKELRAHGTEKFPFQYNREEMQQFDEEKIEWHWHREFEFVKVMYGSVYCLIRTQQIQLEAGEGLFINARVVHSIENCKDGAIANILFSSDLIAAETSVIYDNCIRDFIESECSHIVLRDASAWQEKILEKLEEIFEICSHASFCELDMHIRVCNLWLLFCGHREELVKMEKLGISLRSQSRLRKMMRYIEANYSQKLYLEDIAQAANISKSEAIRCFQMGMQISPVEYLNQYRLCQARFELETTEDSILHIAVAAGFDNSSYFTRIFKKTYGITPRELRKKKEDADNSGY